MNSKRKGKVGELEACKIIHEVLGVSCIRGVQYKGGKDSPDVITGIDGVHFEVKRVENLNIYLAVEQSEKDKGENEIAVVLHRKNRKQWLLTLNFTDIVKLCDRIRNR